MKARASLVAIAIAACPLACSKARGAESADASAPAIASAPIAPTASIAPAVSARPAVSAVAFVAPEPPPTPDGLPPVLEVQEVAETGSMPKGASLSRDGTKFFVTNFGQGDKRNVTVYDAKTLELLDTLDVPGIIVESALSIDGKTLFISNFRRDTVMFVDLASKSVTHEAKVGAVPKVLTASPDGKSVFAANWSADTVTQVDVASASPVRTLKVGKSPRGMAMTKSGKLFVANFYGSSIDVFEGEDFSRRHRVPVCLCPRHLVVSPDDQTLYVSCLTASQLHAIDIATEKLVHSVAVGESPKSIDVSRDGRWVYTADYGESRSVSLVDTKSWTARVFPIPAMDRASGVAVAADGKHALVTGWYDNHVYLVGFEGTGGDPALAKAKMRAWQFVPRHPDPGD
ncbi:MAG: YncE family protein [Labilithrix sp.]|nr:YncE family protein [Labilithrix sp.]